MPPDDHTPLGDAMTHRFPEQTIPQPKPQPRPGESGAEDEDADPVVDTGPGIGDEPTSLRKQRG